MNPRVFAPHQPTGLDPETNRRRPSIDLSPAEEWGDLIFLLDPTDNPLADPQGCAERMRAALVSARFGRMEDKLLLVGNPMLIGMMTTIAADLSPRRELCFLQWNRGRQLYACTRVSLDQKELARSRATG